MEHIRETLLLCHSSINKVTNAARDNPGGDMLHYWIKNNTSVHMYMTIIRVWGSAVYAHFMHHWVCSSHSKVMTYTSVHQYTSSHQQTQDTHDDYTNTTLVLHLKHTYSCLVWTTTILFPSSPLPQIHSLAYQSLFAGVILYFTLLTMSPESFLSMTTKQLLLVRPLPPLHWLSFPLVQ